MKKFYGISIDVDIMEEFKGSCKKLGLPYGPELERMLRIYNNNKIAYGDKAEKTIKEIKENTEILQGIVNNIKESIQA